ncbi:MAG: hypothetical protein VKK05_06320 [Synechococcus sp.]|nr:hypothetical protein [Synechococcus sp.]
MNPVHPSSHPGRSRYPSCSLSRRPQAQAQSSAQLLTWEELLGQR